MGSDVPEPQQSQSETGRGETQTLLLADCACPCSTLFYTIPDSYQRNRFGPKYYIEQLGSPSIIRPMFRDLPGITRLSIGGPSTSYRPTPVEKFISNKPTIMGKHPTTTFTSFGKRHGTSGQKILSPIKVNAKIRHVYSHVSSATNEQGMSSKESRSCSTNSVQTQTDTEMYEHEEAEEDVDEEEEEEECEHEEMKDASTCMTPPPLRDLSISPEIPIPPAYARKLEDLEKITGHIVIQRFFTKADEAFGVWLEKQLGVNVKSVAVGGDVEHEQIEQDGPSIIETKSRERIILEGIAEMEDSIEQEEEAQTLLATEQNKEEGEITSCSKMDLVRCECFADYFRTVLGEISERSEKMEEQLVQTVDVDSSSEKHKTKLPESDTRLLEIEHVKHNTLSNGSGELFLYQRSCIPDVIDVSELYGKIEVKPIAEDITETNDESECAPTVISNPRLSNKEMSQYKVVDYLGRLEAPSPSQTSGSTISLMSEGAEDTKALKVDGAAYDERDQDVKRSISADSCIGTESSGDRTTFNDSGTLLDSARVDTGIPEECETPSAIMEEVEGTKDEAIENEKHEVVEYPGTTEQPTVPSTKQSFDESPLFSRSEPAFAAAGDDGDDADQSDSNTDVSELLIQRGRTASSQRVGTLAEDDEPSGITVDEEDVEDSQEEPDQFDTIIENHEREKRLRPINRKRNMTTQTTESLESSTLSTSCSSSRTTTATSESSYDIELISKSKKYVIPSQGSGELPGIGISKKRCYLPTGASGLNVLNMRFTVGKEFEFRTELRIPPTKSMRGSASSTHSCNYQNLPNVMPSKSTPPSKSQHVQSLPSIRGTPPPPPRPQPSSSAETELKRLWTDVKSKMDSRMETSRSSLQVTGSRIKLISSEDIVLSEQGREEIETNSTKLPPLVNTEQERIKRSLKRLQKMLEDD